MRLRQRYLIPLFTGAGILHFLKPEPFDTIVPQRLPGPARFYTLSSGIAELATAAGLASPRTRRATGPWAAALVLAVWPANLKMACDWQKSARPGWQKAIAWIRVPLQIPLICWCLASDY